MDYLTEKESGSPSLVPLRVNVKGLSGLLSDCALMIVAAGFEDRSRVLFDRFWRGGDCPLLLLRYDSNVIENEETFEHMNARLCGESGHIQVVDIPMSEGRQHGLEGALVAALASYEIRKAGAIWLDISGLPIWAICVSLKVVRESFPFHGIHVFYTEAKTYYPTKEEYDSNVSGNLDRLDARLPESLTAEMSDNLILESFSGVNVRDHATCLVLFLGYEKHRSFGVVDQINPSKLVLAYGIPRPRNLEWRVELSRRLHRRLLAERSTAEEKVSTFLPQESVELLRRYYYYLYDDHNFCVTPACSKLQTVGVYLFWEEYRDVQLVFPLPVRYLPNRYSEGVGQMFVLRLPDPPGLKGYISRGGGQISSFDRDNG